MARKPSSRCMPANVKVKMDGRPPPDDVNSSSPTDFLLGDFEAINIGARKKEAKSDVKKEIEIYSGEDSDAQDANILENWSSVDRITVDGSESSEWGRSISSSMSWFDESEHEATLKVKSMLDNIDCMLYGEPHTPLPKPLAEECQQWKQRFPHLRVVGHRISVCPTITTENGINYSQSNHAGVKGDDAASTSEELQDSDEGEEEVYASHGIVEPLQALSHDFGLQNEYLEDSECERIKEALLNELATHVWKEVLVPSMKTALEQQNSDVALSSSRGEGEPIRTPIAENQSTSRNSDRKSDTSSDKQFQLGLSLSAREERIWPQSTNELGDSPECYRRYSDQFSYCDVKCGNDFMSLGTVVEKDIGKWEMKELKKRRTSRKSGKGSNQKNSNFVKDNLETANSTVLHDRKLWTSSTRSKQIGVLEDLSPFEKASAWTNSVSEGLDFSGRYNPPKKTNRLILPAIDHQRVTQNYELSSNSMSRSSSALPKLPDRSFRCEVSRPIMSSYQNKMLHQECGRKAHSIKYHEIKSLKSCSDSNERMTENTGYYSGNLSSKSTKNTKRKERRSSNPQDKKYSLS